MESVERYRVEISIKSSMSHYVFESLLKIHLMEFIYVRFISQSEGMSSLQHNNRAPAQNIVIHVTFHLSLSLTFVALWKRLKHFDNSL